MPVPLLAAGGAMALGGLIGGLASNGRSTAQRSYWGGDQAAEDAYRKQQNERNAYGYGQQQMAIGDYQGVISGTAPSLAQMQMQRGTQASAANAANLAGSAQGGGGVQLQAMQMAQRQNALASADANMNAAMLRASEVAQARDARAQLATQMQGAAQQGLQQVNGMAMQNQADVNAQNLAMENAQRQRQQQMFGSLMSAGGSMMTMGAGGMMAPAGAAGGAAAGGQTMALPDPTAYLRSQLRQGPAPSYDYGGGVSDVQDPWTKRYV